jgi:hypothetical protein
MGDNAPFLIVKFVEVAFAPADARETSRETCAMAMSKKVTTDHSLK